MSNLEYNDRIIGFNEQELGFYTLNTSVKVTYIEVRMCNPIGLEDSHSYKHIFHINTSMGQTTHCAR